MIIYLPDSETLSFWRSVFGDDYQYSLPLPLESQALIVIPPLYFTIEEIENFINLNSENSLIIFIPKNGTQIPSLRIEFERKYVEGKIHEIEGFNEISWIGNIISYEGEIICTGVCNKITDVITIRNLTKNVIFSSIFISPFTESQFVQYLNYVTKFVSMERRPVIDFWEILETKTNLPFLRKAYELRNKESSLNELFDKFPSIYERLKAQSVIKEDMLSEEYQKFLKDNWSDPRVKKVTW